jgi:hypothetical protein
MDTTSTGTCGALPDVEGAGAPSRRQQQQQQRRRRRLAVLFRRLWSCSSSSAAAGAGNPEADIRLGRIR